MKHAVLSLPLALLIGVQGAAAQTYRVDDHRDAMMSGFGAAVAVAERDVLIGEPLNTRTSGVVYVYRKDRSGNWVEVQRLTASAADLRDYFGRSLAVEGNTLIVGSTARDSSTGGVFVFQRDASGRWTETQQLGASDGYKGNSLGRMAVLRGDLAAVAAWGNNKGAGAVYVYRRDARTGRWAEQAKLAASDAKENDFFGTSIAMDGDRILVGATQRTQRAGGAYLFERDAGSGAWKEAAKLEPQALQPNTAFGGSVALMGDQALVAAPGFGGFMGTVFVFERDAETGEWTERGRLNAFDGGAGAQFGESMTIVGTELWVGAPGVEEDAGRIYRFRRDASGSWVSTSKLAVAGLQARDQFGSTVAVRGNVAAVGLTGADFGEGVAVILERDARSGEWARRARVLSEETPIAAVTGGKVDCRDGGAAIFRCSDVDLLAFLPIAAIGGRRGVRLNDIWGWTDPQSGREFALVGRIDGTSFVDVTDPTRPVYIGDLPMTQGARANAWRDIKVYKDHAFIVADGAGKHGMQVFDLRQLPGVKAPPVTFKETAHYPNIYSAHNIVINESTGFAYTVGSGMGGETCGGGLHMVDIREPGTPTFAGCFADPATGRRKTGYSHDAQCVTYTGPDAEHRGKEICLGSNETALSIADVTDKAHPKPLAMAAYPNVGYTHQGWLTDDQRYFLMDDEGDELSGTVAGTRTLIWDVADLDDPVLIKEYISENRASDHNLYVKGNLVYQSNYASGLRILDITDIKNPVPVGHFDTLPWGEDAPGFSGSWSNYPYFKSGTVVVTSIGEGLFVVKKRERLVP